MKVKAQDLFSVVRQVVREEMERIAPELIRRHLTETYLKRIVLETASRSGSKISELIDLPKDEEHIPEPPPNADRGIYNDMNGAVRKHEESKLLSRDNPLSFVYENVRPIPDDNATGIPSVPISPDAFAGMAAMVEKMEQRGPALPDLVAARSDHGMTYEQKMIELERRRKLLDVPAGKVSR